MKTYKYQALSILLFTTVAAFFLVGFTKPNNKNAQNQSVIWNKTTHDFKNIMMGKDAVFVFTCKNKTKKIVTIVKVEPGCSCTVSEFTSTPIKPNRKGSVTATYNTKNRPGFFKKFIKVTFADSTTTDLVITGSVVTE